MGASRLLWVWAQLAMVVHVARVARCEEQYPSLWLNADLLLESSDEALTSGTGTFDVFKTERDAKAAAGGQSPQVASSLPANHPPVIDEDADCPTGAVLEATTVEGAAKPCTELENAAQWADAAQCFAKERVKREDDEEASSKESHMRDLIYLLLAEARCKISLGVAGTCAEGGNCAADTVALDDGGESYGIKTEALLASANRLLEFASGDTAGLQTSLRDLEKRNTPA